MSETLVIIRPSFKRICNDDSCRAAILNHMLYWIARKKKQGQDYWYETGEEIYKSLAETWGLNAIRKGINDILELGFVGEMTNPKWKSDRTKHFYFEQEQSQALFQAFENYEICPLCLNLPQEIIDLFTPHLLNLTNAIIKTNKCICYNHQMDLLNLTNPSVNSNAAITKITPRESTKTTNKEDSFSHVPNGNAETTKPSSPSQAPSQQKGNGIEKRTSPRKQKQEYHQYTLLEQECLEVWNSCHMIPLSEESEQKHASAFIAFARIVETSRGKVQPSDIKRIFDYLEGLEYKGNHYHHGKLTPQKIVDNAQIALTALSNPPKPASKPASTSSTSSGYHQLTREELEADMERGRHWTAMLYLDIPEEQVVYQGEIIPERLVYQYRRNSFDGLGKLVEQYAEQYNIPITDKLAALIRLNDATWAYGGIEAAYLAFV